MLPDLQTTPHRPDPRAGLVSPFDALQREADGSLPRADDVGTQDDAALLRLAGAVVTALVLLAAAGTLLA